MANRPGETEGATTRHLLGEIRQGSREALDALLPLVYDELRILAHRQRSRWRGDYTMGTTVLVHEAYLKLAKQERLAVGTRAHFFALASRAMRHILCNYARGRGAVKRGGDIDFVALDSPGAIPKGDTPSDDAAAGRLLALDAALLRLERAHPRRSRVVECRFFGGMTVDDTAAALSIAPRTVKRDWAAAQDWLRSEILQLEGGEGGDVQTLDELAAATLPPLMAALTQPYVRELTPGERVGQYEILEPLGRGGMGVVYKAYDARLDRHVALKFIPFPVGAEEKARARLLDEARAASALDHPNICTVYDVGELDDGRMFLSLACYEGETLDEKVRRGPLPVGEAVAIIRQIAEGLAAAQRRGIVHRDIKPSNVMVTDEGIVKILDFGIATLRLDVATEGSAAGTVGYMSPEQATGDGVDGRADLWSLGVVMYEMLTGRLPFEGADRQRLLEAIRDAPPPPVSSLRSGVPPAVTGLVDTCLQMDPEARYRDADELLAELRALPGSEPRAIATPVRLAVLPLDAAPSEADVGYLADAIADELITRLSGLSGLHVIARASALAASERSAGARDIGTELAADTLVHGTIGRSGEDVVITMELLDVDAGEVLWRIEQTVPVAELQRALGTIAWQIMSTLALQVHGDEGRRLARSGTETADAYALYLKGRYFWNKRDRSNIEQARDCFQEALDLDPVFARAWAGLADTFTVMGGYQLLQPEDAYPRARAAAERALDLDEGLAEAHASLATVLADYYWSWHTAGQHYRRALELNPSYATARLWFAGYLRDLGQVDEALVQVRAARELDPLSVPTHGAEGITLYVARRYGEAVAVYRRLLEITPEYAYASFLLALALIQQRQYPEALASLEQAQAWPGALAGIRGATGYIHAVLGRTDEAHRMLEALDQSGPEGQSTWFMRVVIRVGLGEKGHALDLLEQALERRDKQVRLLRIEPLLDPLRGDPRFQALLEKVGLDDDAVARALAP